MKFLKQTDYTVYATNRKYVQISMQIYKIKKELELVSRSHSLYCL